jgi:hypothetical protein
MKIATPSIMSDNMSIRSNNYMHAIEGFKRQIENIKLRQSNIYRQSIAGAFQTPAAEKSGGAAMMMKSIGNGMPIS